MRFNQRGYTALLGVVCGALPPMAYAEIAYVEAAQAVQTARTTSCLGEFYQNTPPLLLKKSLSSSTYPLCFNGFGLMYSGVSRTPLWVGEYLTPQRLSTRFSRDDRFYEEGRIPSEYRSRLSDYARSGFDRGHMAPRADMGTLESQQDSYSLANMVPQVPQHNQGAWRQLEEAVRRLAQTQPVYVVTGPLYLGQSVQKVGNVLVPTHLFKAVYVPESGIATAYFSANDTAGRIDLISLCALESQLGINVYPLLDARTKRQVYRLPLTASNNSLSNDSPSNLQPLSVDRASRCVPQPSAALLEQTRAAFRQAPPARQIEREANVESNPTQAVPQPPIQPKSQVDKAPPAPPANKPWWKQWFDWL